MESIFTPGQVAPLGVYLNAIGGQTIDITNFALKIVLYEDLFSNVMTGHIVMDDAASIIYNITGYETITLGFATPGTEATIDGVFHITAIDNRVPGEGSQAYVLRLMSAHGFIDNTLIISKKFKGTPTDIIRNVFTEYFGVNKKLVILNGRDNNSLAVVSPYWSPMKLINWIAQRSYHDAPNKMFFQSNKAFYLASIEDLVQLPTVAKYLYSPISNKNYDIFKTYSVIKNLAPIRFFDVLEAQDNGYFGSTLLTHDITKKQYDVKYYNHLAQYKKYKHLEKTFDEIYIKTFAGIESFRRVKTEQSSIFPEAYSPNYKNWLPQRNSLMYEASNLRIQVTVPGITTLEVGNVVECSIATAIAKSPGDDLSDIQDPYLSGRYLITAISHSFTLNSHEMTMELMKDSYTKV